MMIAAIVLVLAAIGAFGCLANEETVCFPNEFRGTVECVTVPSGSHCAYYPLLDRVSCADDDGNIFTPARAERD